MKLISIVSKTLGDETCTGDDCFISFQSRVASYGPIFIYIVNNYQCEISNIRYCHEW